MVQWLGLHTPNASGPGSILGQGSRSHMSQLRPGAAKLNKYQKKPYNEVPPHTDQNGHHQKYIYKQ